MIGFLRRVIGLGPCEPKKVKLGADLSQRWKAFIESPAAKGEPEIAPAKVPSVKPLVGKKRGHWAVLYRRVS